MDGCQEYKYWLLLSLKLKKNLLIQDFFPSMEKKKHFIVGHWGNGRTPYYICIVDKFHSVCILLNIMAKASKYP